MRRKEFVQWIRKNYFPTPQVIESSRFQEPEKLINPTIEIAWLVEQAAKSISSKVQDVAFLLELSSKLAQAGDDYLRETDDEDGTAASAFYAINHQVEQWFGFSCEASVRSHSIH